MLRNALLAFAIAGVSYSAEAQQRDATATLPPGTILHVVRRGDTLADIARRFLGDFRRWPELFKANADQIRNANLIFPGQRLYVGADGKPTFNAPAVVSRDDAAEARPARAIPLGRSTAGQASSVLDNATINGRVLRPTVRAGEAEAAPFLVPARTKLTSGSLIARGDATVIEAASTRDQFQLFDDVDLLLPVGVRGAVGQRLGVYQPGEEVRRGKLRSRVMQPAGVVQITALGTGRAARARVTAMYANIKRGDLVLPLDSAPTPGTVRPQDVTNGPVYDVAYVSGSVVLPTVQNYIVISLPAGAAARVGDQFTLFAEGSSLTERPGNVSPSTDVAQASVVRVTSEGATAIIVGHEQPAVRVGMKARLTARMP